jgi:hypothetical protein
MRMIERRIGADAHEFLRTDFDDGDTRVIVEVRNNVVGHIFTFGGGGPSANWIRSVIATHHNDRNLRFLESRAEIRTTVPQVPCKFDTILSSWRSPSFVGAVVS